MAQLVDLGLSKKAIRHRVLRGRLHPVLRGVYAVGRPEIDRRGRWMAAVLACGPTAVLSHLSAAELWGFDLEGRRFGRRAGHAVPLDGGAALVDVSVRTCSHRRVQGVRLHRREGLRPRDVTARERIRVTRPVQTLIDLATVLGAPVLERAVSEADRLGLVDPERLVRALDAHPARSGVGRLRALLEKQVFRLTDSELERSFLRLLRRARIPLPRTGARLQGFRVDFYWPDQGLVVETDGLRYHRTAAQQGRDSEREQVHAAAGLAVLRFTHAQIRDEPERVARTLRAVLARLGADSSGRAA